MGFSCWHVSRILHLDNYIGQLQHLVPCSFFADEIVSLTFFEGQACLGKLALSRVSVLAVQVQSLS